MKLFKLKYAVLVAVGVAFAVTSCKKSYLDVNNDPNQSLSSRVDLQLTTGELYTSIGVGQRMFSNLNQWCQYFTGGPGVSLTDPDKHIMASSEGNELWRSLYRSSVNLNYIIDKAPEQKYYVAIAKIIKAYNMQVCLDLFGDIPYSEALQGNSENQILHPRYDAAATVYGQLQAEVADAIAIIDAADATGGYTHPGADDVIYAGDMAKWRKFANSLLLKMVVRTGTGTAPSTNAADYITDNADAAMVSFPGGTSGSNPFYNAAKSTALGNFYIATTTSMDYLNNTGDPRLNYFYDPNGEGQQIGLTFGGIEAAPVGKTYSTPAGAKTGDGVLFSPTMPVVLLSAWEGNLLLAEAGIGDAKANYEEAVHQNCAYLGLADGADTTYLKGAGAFNAGSPLKSIAYQKWVCMTGIQPIESWIETRRYDKAGQEWFASPGGIFVAPLKNSLGAFPTILPYPESEESLNQSFPGQHALTAKVFWDN